MRVILKFKKFKYNISISYEDQPVSDKLDLNLKSKEREYNHKSFYDVGLKDGKFGFFCHDCQGLLISSLHFYADKCFIKNNNNYKILSLYSSRYLESFTSNINSVFKTYTLTGVEEEARFKFGFSEGRLLSLINVGGKSKNIRNISGFSQLIY